MTLTTPLAASSPNPSPRLTTVILLVGSSRLLLRTAQAQVLSERCGIRGRVSLAETRENEEGLHALVQDSDVDLH